MGVGGLQKGPEMSNVTCECFLTQHAGPNSAPYSPPEDDKQAETTAG